MSEEPLLQRLKLIQLLLGQISFHDPLYTPLKEAERVATSQWLRYLAARRREEAGAVAYEAWLYGRFTDCVSYA